MSLDDCSHDVERFRAVLAQRLGLLLGFLAEPLRRRSEAHRQTLDVYLDTLEASSGRSGRATPRGHRAKPLPISSDAGSRKRASTSSRRSAVRLEERNLAEATLDLWRPNNYGWSSTSLRRSVEEESGLE
jgi:hypothetical protein